MASARLMAAPIGVSPMATSLGDRKPSAVTKSCIVCTGPKVTMATSTRLAAIESAWS